MSDPGGLALCEKVGDGAAHGVSDECDCRHVKLVQDTEDVVLHELE